MLPNETRHRMSNMSLKFEHQSMPFIGALYHWA